MNAPVRPNRLFDRLMRQALIEIGEDKPQLSRRRNTGYLSMDQIDAVPVFDRGPQRFPHAEARSRS